MVKNLIRVLLDFNQRTGNSLPFIFATTTTSEMIPSCLRDQAAEAQVGMFCQFAPQHLILSHAATGWFLVSVCTKMLPLSRIRDLRSIPLDL